MNTREIGREGENLAVAYLVENNATILARNFCLRDAEIDIIFEEPAGHNRFGIDKYIVFAEVKYRNSESHGRAYESVNSGKIKKICKAAKVFMYKFHYPESTPVRFDVISIEKGSINHIKNAFDFVN